MTTPRARFLRARAPHRARVTVVPEIIAHFRCAKCHTTHQVAVPPEKLVPDKGDGRAAVVRCSRCGYLQKVPVREKGA